MDNLYQVRVWYEETHLRTICGQGACVQLPDDKVLRPSSQMSPSSGEQDDLRVRQPLLLQRMPDEKSQLRVSLNTFFLFCFWIGHTMMRLFFIGSTYTGYRCRHASRTLSLSSGDVAGCAPQPSIPSAGVTTRLTLTSASWTWSGVVARGRCGRRRQVAPPTPSSTKNMMANAESPERRLEIISIDDMFKNCHLSSYLFGLVWKV